MTPSASRSEPSKSACSTTSAPFSPAYEAKYRAWWAERVRALKESNTPLQPSAWAEQKRYLPSQLSPMPGPYRFELTPYLREILDCFSVDSPIREVTMMKGAQVGATVTAENVLGYFIEHVRTAPVLWASADSDLAKGRLTSNIVPMLHESGLMHLIRSVDEGNSRKTGKTDEKLEWDGGGFCIPFGAKNAAKMRQWSIQVLVNDELDGWPLTVGKDGDPVALFRDRTRAFEGSRKIFNISTPTVLGQSKIHARFLDGDQRYYNVRCLSCEFQQVLCFQKFTKDGVQYGLTWDYDSEGHLIRESVRFLCKNCQRAHFESDKTRLLDPRNGAEWVPTATPSTRDHRSYHLGGLYSPAGMASWSGQVEQYHEAYDHRRERFKDLGKLQVFYNNVLGEPFEQRGEKVRIDAVSGHRRAAYRFGEVPNKYALEHCLSPILCVTCAVDVHGDQLPTAVIGWTRGKRPFLLDYWRLGVENGTAVGNTEQLDDPATWGKLREIIENREYVADDGKRYRIQFTLIDSGYRADQVYEFAQEYSAGVSPAKGRVQPRGTADKPYAQFHTPTGVAGYLITVDWYKDRLSAALRREWNGLGVQPIGCFNCPSDTSEKQLRELTVETKVAKPGSESGYEWRRPAGAANELWDLLVYNSCGLDLIAWDVCRNQIELDDVDWASFWDLCEREKLFFTD